MKKKYKVLHLVGSLDAVGGLERIIAEIVAHLNQEEFTAEIWCIYKGGKYADELKQQGLTVRILNIKSYYNPLNIFKLALAFREAQPDIIHTHVYFAATIGRIAAFMAGVKVIIHHVHSSYWQYSLRNVWIERMLSYVTSKIICVSKHTQDFVINHEGIVASKTVVIYNGISVENGCSKIDARKIYQVSQEHIVVTTVASLSENKGHKFLIEAISLLVGQYPQIQCWIIGQGPLEAELKRYVHALKLDGNIVFWSERRDVIQMLLASNIFVLASIQREGMPVSVLEAMACAVPMVVTQVGGLPEVIEDQVNGLVVRPKDSVDLSKAIEKLIANDQQRMEYSRQATQKFQQYFDSKIMISKIEQLYKEALTSNA